MNPISYIIIQILSYLKAHNEYFLRCPNLCIVGKEGNRCAIIQTGHLKVIILSYNDLNSKSAFSRLRIIIKIEVELRFLQPRHPIIVSKSLSTRLGNTAFAYHL